MSLKNFRDVEVKGKTFHCSVSDEGEFFADFDGEQVRAESLKQLTEKLAERIKKSKRVNIPFCLWESASWRDDGPGHLRTGVILGIHGSNDNILAKFDDEARSQQLSRGSGFFEPSAGEELKRLEQAAADAQNALESFKKKHQFNAHERVCEILGKTEGAA